MFTGIVERTGRVVSRIRRDPGERLTLDLGDLNQHVELGQSLALNGVCLTAAERSPAGIAFDLAGETLRVTNLADLAPGDAVNVERALALGARLDGHLVQGHVDGTGQVRSLGLRGDDRWLEVAAAPELLRGMLFKGSITVDGISLTVATLGESTFSCTLIPHTFAVTNLARRRPGDRVNLETDLVGKWVRRMVETGELRLP